MLENYNKAIRDNIPAIITANGKKCEYITLEDNVFLQKLHQKLEEELREYKTSNELEELADILEVIYRIVELRGGTKELLEELRLKKRQIRGGFEKNLFLVNVHD